MTAMRLMAACALFAMALGGCSSSPPVRYYDLEALETGDAVGGGTSLTVGVGPLRAPSYLSRSQFVTRRGDGTVVMDDFNRWVEPVDDAIYRIVAGNLDRLVDRAVVVAYPYTYNADLDYQLIGRISRFDADEDGTAVLQLQWGIISSREEFLVPLRRSRYEAVAAEPRDHVAVARAMSEALREFSRDVARSLDALIKHAGG